MRPSRRSLACTRARCDLRTKRRPSESRRGFRHRAGIVSGAAALKPRKRSAGGPEHHHGVAARERARQASGRRKPERGVMRNGRAVTLVAAVTLAIATAVGVRAAAFTLGPLVQVSGGQPARRL
jgi:hypothetical protein